MTADWDGPPRPVPSFPVLGGAVRAAQTAGADAVAEYGGIR